MSWGPGDQPVRSKNTTAVVFLKRAGGGTIEPHPPQKKTVPGHTPRPFFSFMDKNIPICYHFVIMQLLQTSLPWIQVALSIILMGLVMIQQGEGSLGAAFGGDSTAGSFRTKRGAEKVIFNATIVIAILFVLSAIVTLLVK